jgi:hypothetical protein
MLVSYFQNDIGNSRGVVNAMPVFEAAPERAMPAADCRPSQPQVLEQVAA